jgi:hypothetical protein
MNFSTLISKFGEEKRKNFVGESTAILISLSSSFGYRNVSEIKRNILKNISIILYFYPMPIEIKQLIENPEISNSAKFGHLSRLIIKVAKEVGIPKIYIDDYVNIKRGLKIISSVANNEIEIRRTLQFKTLQLTEAICEKIIDIEKQ